MQLRDPRVKLYEAVEHPVGGAAGLYSRGDGSSVGDDGSSVEDDGSSESYRRNFGRSLS